MKISNVIFVQYASKPGYLDGHQLWFLVFDDLVVDEAKLALQTTPVEIDMQVYFLEYSTFSSLVTVEEVYRPSPDTYVKYEHVGLWFDDHGFIATARDFWERRADLTGVSFTAGTISVRSLILVFRG